MFGVFDACVCVLCVCVCLCVCVFDVCVCTYVCVCVCVFTAQHPKQGLCRAILNCVKPRVELQLRESQCGFEKGRGCADQLFSLRIMMEKACEYCSPLYTCL